MKKSLFTPWLRALFSVCSIVILLTTGCHKNKETDTPVETTAPAYFTLPDGADERLPLLLKHVKAEEAKAPFFADIVQEYGQPVWDKGIIGVRGATILYAIPLKQEGKSLSGCIVFELEEKLRFKIYENHDFFRYGFSTKKGAVNGGKVRNLMMALNFRLPPADPDNPDPGVPPEDCVNSAREVAMLKHARAANPGKELHLQQKMIAVTTCYSWTTCGGDGHGNCVTEVTYHEQCFTDTYWLPDGGSGSGGGSGGGTSEGGGGGGGGSAPTNPPQEPCPGIDEPTPEPISEPVPVAEVDMLAIPCPSSFNMVRQHENWQSAVVTGYRFGLYNRSGNKLDYYVEIGAMEVGLPYITYNGDIVHHSTAQAMITQAATLAEGEALALLNAYLILNPGTRPSQVNYEPYKQVFKLALKTHIDLFLRADYNYGQNASPSRVTFDSASFGLKDQTQYRPLKYKGRDC